MTNTCEYRETDCSYCSTEDHKKISKKTVKLSMPFAKEKNVETDEFLCPFCRVGFDNLINQLYTDIERLKEESHSNVLIKLLELGISFLDIAKCFGLHTKTLNEWKQGIFSEEAMVLFRCIAIDPSMLKHSKIESNVLLPVKQNPIKITFR